MTPRIERRVLTTEPVRLSGMSSLVSRVLVGRGITDPKGVTYSLSELQPFQSLKDIDSAAALLVDAISTQKHILVVGDYDADGATSCAVAIRGLRMLGANNVDFLIPNRLEYGYGLTPEIVEVALNMGPDLIVTVDNGISSVEGVAAAQRSGIPVLVTDHHLPADELPKAAAIVNPNQPGCGFPCKSTAGVGVMFYVLMATRAKLRDSGLFNNETQPNMAQLLDLVALGTVADLVPLERNNRLMVAQGIARIRQGRCQLGIKALLEVANREIQRTTTADFSFVVAPRLNAAGRISDMSLGVRALLTDESTEAADLAVELDKLNRQRREIESEMQGTAFTYLEGLGSLHPDKDSPVGVCLFDESWHPGVIGILASKVKALVHRPVIAFAPGGDDCLRGSARSIEGFHMRDALETINRDHPKLLARFGGHAMAAGLTITTKDYASFATVFNETAAGLLSQDQLAGVIRSDGALKPSELTLEMADELAAMGPWGQGFPEPLFDGEFLIEQCQLLKQRHLKIVLRHLDSPTPLNGIYFNVDPGLDTQSLTRAKIVYRLEPNEFLGNRSLNLVIEHLVPIE